MSYYKVHGDVNSKVRKINGTPIPLALSLAHQYARKYNNISSVEDIVSAAFLGLCKASRDVDPKAKNKASLYAYKRIQGEILDLVRKEAVHKTRYELADDELLSRIYKDPVVEELIATKQLKEVLRTIMFRELSAEQRKILYLVFWRGYKDKEAANEFEICTITFRKRKTLAIEAFRCALAKRGIRCL